METTAPPLVCPLAWRPQSNSTALVFPTWREEEEQAVPLSLERHPLTGESRWQLGEQTSREFWWEDPRLPFLQLRPLLKRECRSVRMSLAELAVHLHELFPCSDEDLPSRLETISTQLLELNWLPKFSGEAAKRAWKAGAPNPAVYEALPTLSPLQRNLLTALILRRRLRSCKTEDEQRFIVQMQEFLGLPLEVPPLRAKAPEAQTIKPPEAPKPPVAVRPPEPEVIPLAAPVEDELEDEPLPELEAGDRWIGVGELAKMLKTGKPFAKRVLDNGHIPWEQDGATRVVRFSDAQAYVERAEAG